MSVLDLAFSQIDLFSVRLGRPEFLVNHTGRRAYNLDNFMRTLDAGYAQGGGTVAAAQPTSRSR